MLYMRMLPMGSWINQLVSNWWHSLGKVMGRCSPTGGSKSLGVNVEIV